jgi:hypothetical protein
MFNILKHKENVNKNNTEIPSQSIQNSYHQVNKQPQIMARFLGQKELLYPVGRNVN